LVKLTSKSSQPQNGILRIESNHATSGKVLSIDADGLNDGVAIDINNNGADLSTGSLIKLTSKSSGPENGLLSITANKLSNGVAIDINNNGTDLSTGSLIKVTSQVSGDNKGREGLVKIIANDMTDGKGLVIESKKLSKGTGIELVNNEELTSGKLLNLQTSSKLAHNPVAIDASSMTNGEVMKIEGDALTSGSALVLTTNDGSSMMSSLSSENIEMIANNSGKILVSKSVFDKFHLYDKINLESCNGFKKHASADEFMITKKTRNVTKKT